MKTLSVFDSNEDITNFVQGKIRVSGMDIFCRWNTKMFDPLFGNQSYVEGPGFTGTFQGWLEYTNEYQNQN